MSRNFGLPPSPPRQIAGTDVLASLVFAAFMFAAGAGLMFGAIYIQHLLRARGWHV